MNGSVPATGDLLPPASGAGIGGIKHVLWLDIIDEHHGESKLRPIQVHVAHITIGLDATMTSW